MLWTLCREANQREEVKRKKELEEIERVKAEMERMDLIRIQQQQESKKTEEEKKQRRREAAMVSTVVSAEWGSVGVGGGCVIDVRRCAPFPSLSLVRAFRHCREVPFATMSHSAVRLTHRLRRRSAGSILSRSSTCRRLRGRLL